MMKRKRRVFVSLVATLFVLLLFNFALMCWAIVMKEPPKTTAGGILLKNCSRIRCPTESTPRISSG